MSDFDLEAWQRACRSIGPDVAAVALMLRNAARERADADYICIDLAAMRELEVHGPHRAKRQMQLLLDAFTSLCAIAVARLEKRGYLRVERLSDGVLRCFFTMPDQVCGDSDVLLATHYIC